MIKIRTRRDAIIEACKHWTRYEDSEDGADRKLYRAIKKLDPKTATRAQVDKIIGNSTWTELRCDACDKDNEIVIEFGINNEYSDMSAASVCKKCLLKGALLVAHKEAYVE